MGVRVGYVYHPSGYTQQNQRKYPQGVSVTEHQRNEIRSRAIEVTSHHGDQILLLDEKAAEIADREGLKLFPWVSHAHGFKMATKVTELYADITEEIF